MAPASVMTLLEVVQVYVGVPLLAWTSEARTAAEPPSLSASDAGVIRKSVTHSGPGGGTTGNAKGGNTSTRRDRPAGPGKRSRAPRLSVVMVSAGARPPVMRFKAARRAASTAAARRRPRAALYASPPEASVCPTMRSVWIGVGVLWLARRQRARPMIVGWWRGRTASRSRSKQGRTSGTRMPVQVEGMGPGGGQPSASSPTSPPVPCLPIARRGDRGSLVRVKPGGESLVLRQGFCAGPCEACDPRSSLLSRRPHPPGAPMGVERAFFFRKPHPPGPHGR